MASAYAIYLFKILLKIKINEYLSQGKHLYLSTSRICWSWTYPVICICNVGDSTHSPEQNLIVHIAALWIQSKRTTRNEHLFFVLPQSLCIISDEEMASGGELSSTSKVNIYIHIYNIMLYNTYSNEYMCSILRKFFLFIYFIFISYFFVRIFTRMIPNHSRGLLLSVYLPWAPTSQDPTTVQGKRDYILVNEKWLCSWYRTEHSIWRIFLSFFFSEESRYPYAIFVKLKNSTLDNRICDQFIFVHFAFITVGCTLTRFKWQGLHLAMATAATGLMNC